MVNQNYKHLSSVFFQRALLYNSLTLSILQLAIHSNVEILNVAWPTKNLHHFVTIGLQFLFLQRVPSRLTGNLARPLSPRSSSICRSTTVFDPWKRVPSVDDRVASSAHIWPWLSGRTRSSRLARSLMCKWGGSASVLVLANFG